MLRGTNPPDTTIHKITEEHSMFEEGNNSMDMMYQTFTSDFNKSNIAADYLKQ